MDRSFDLVCVQPVEAWRDEERENEVEGMVVRNTAFLWEATDWNFPAVNVPIHCPPVSPVKMGWGSGEGEAIEMSCRELCKVITAFTELGRNFYINIWKAAYEAIIALWNLGTNSAVGQRKPWKILAELVSRRTFRMHDDLQPVALHSDVGARAVADFSV